MAAPNALRGGTIQQCDAALMRLGAPAVRAFRSRKREWRMAVRSGRWSPCARLFIIAAARPKSGRALSMDDHRISRYDLC